jgi:DNA-binding NarL/FixJ family response regulator
MVAIRVVLADDHRLVCEGLAALLGSVSGLEVIAQVHNGLEAVSIVRQLRPDVVVMDLMMPGLNGIEATRQVVRSNPRTKVLCLSVHIERHLVNAMLDAGASGYVLKDCAFEELATAIHAVAAGRAYLSPAVASLVVEEYRAGRTAAHDSANHELTDRERQIVQLLAEGHSTKEIATRLCVSVKTVATHREHAMDKLHVGSVAELTKYAVREGLTQLGPMPGDSGSTFTHGPRR